MQRYFGVLGTATLLATSLFGLAPKANAQIMLSTMETIREEKVVFKCSQDVSGDWVTIPQYVEQVTYVRYPNTVVSEEIRFQSDEALVSWTKSLDNGRFIPESRCYTVSERLTDLVSGIAAAKRNMKPSMEMGESFISALEEVSDISRATGVYGRNLFGEYISERVILASDQNITGAYIPLRTRHTVVEDPTDADQTVIFTLSPENAKHWDEVLSSFKSGVSVAAGGEADPSVELPIQE